MKVEYADPIDEIKLRYIILHSIENLESKLSEIFEHVSSSYDMETAAGIFESKTTSAKAKNDQVLSLVDIQITDMPYSSVGKFEDNALDEKGIIEICKTFDSFKMEENRVFLAELYDMEMKIREIYTAVARLENVSLQDSKVKPVQEFRGNETVFKERLMNEFFFIEFSDYMNVDSRREPSLKDVLNALGHVTKVEEIGRIINDLSYPTLHLKERFNELSNIPETIGRMGKLRNCIAHNRYIAESDAENFEKAKNTVDDVYNAFVAKFRSQEI